MFIRIKNLLLLGLLRLMHQLFGKYRNCLLHVMDIYIKPCKLCFLRLLYYKQVIQNVDFSCNSFIWLRFWFVVHIFLLREDCPLVFQGNWRSILLLLTPIFDKKKPNQIPLILIQPSERCSVFFGYQLYVQIPFLFVNHNYVMLSCSVILLILLCFIYF